MLFDKDKSKFNWDENKNQSNIKKHKISFEEAATVFYDDNAVYINDISHSYEEERFLVIGRSKQYRFLFVCHCYKENDIIRIISARKATVHEINLYGEENYGS